MGHTNLGLVTESIHTYLLLSFKLIHLKLLENKDEVRMKGKDLKESINCFGNLQLLPDLFCTRDWSYQAKFWTIPVSGDLKVLDSPQKLQGWVRVKTKQLLIGWRKRKRPECRCHCEWSKKYVPWVDMGQLTSELHMWSVISWDLICFQGGVVPKLCGTTFWLSSHCGVRGSVFVSNMIHLGSVMAFVFLSPPSACGVNFHFNGV